MMQFLAIRELSITASPPQLMPAHTAEHADIRQLLTSWQHQAGDAPMPRSPRIGRDIAPLLKRVQLCDVVDNGRDFRFRLLGDAVFPWLPVKQTGRLVSEHPDMGVRLRYPVLMGEVMRLKGPVRGLATRVTEHATAQIESIWLPYGDGEVRQIMGLNVATWEERGTFIPLAGPVLA